MLHLSRNYIWAIEPRNQQYVYGQEKPLTADDEELVVEKTGVVPYNRGVEGLMDGLGRHVVHQLVISEPQVTAVLH